MFDYTKGVITALIVLLVIKVGSEMLFAAANM